MGVSLVSALALYFAGFAFFTYACIIADPTTSSISRALTEQLPRFSLGVLRRLVGPELFGRLEGLSRYGLVFVYLVLVLGCWSCMFAYGYPLITSSIHVSSIHKYMGYLTFMACMSSWWYASNMSPGVITSRNMAKFDHFPYDNLLFTNKVCPTLKIRKIARSKYDRVWNSHIPRFDHFCGWLNQPIGEENYRFFLMFLTIHVMMCWYGTIVTAKLFWGETIDADLFNATFFVAETGQEIKATKMVVFQYLLAKHFYLASVLLVMAIMGIVLTAFLGFHLYITARGMTTNEYFKWKQVRKWHKQVKQRYNEAMRKGHVVDASSQLKLTVTDETDISCSGPKTHKEGSEQDESKEEEKVVDPGPLPRNIYDNGFVENFKEVIFPRSLRQDALDRWKKAHTNSSMKLVSIESKQASNGKAKAT